MKLSKISGLDKNLINQKYFYESLINEALMKKLINEEAYALIRLQELNLLRDKSLKLSGGHTSVISKGAATDLIHNNNFIISYYLKKLDDPLDELLNTDLKTILNNGEKLLSKDLFKAKMFCNYMQKNMLNIPNEFYQSTFKVHVKEALDKYNYSYEADNKIITADYQTSIYPDLLGLEFLNNYMTFFNYENLFLQHFNTNNINAFLYRMSPNIMEHNINIYEAVLIVVICSKIINYDINNIYIDSLGHELLRMKLIEKNSEEIKDIIYSAVKSTIKELGITGNLVNYIMVTVNNVDKRIISSVYRDSLANLLP